jgi:dimethylargininase
MLTAITRAVSPAINQCELSFHERRPIDLDRCIAQHSAYEECLKLLGVTVVSLAAEPTLPDSVFVEDAAVVLDEIAVITRMGAPSRRPESAGLAETISRFRRVEFLKEPATLEGGDVLRIGRRLFIGMTARTNVEGIDQMKRLVQPYGFAVESIEVRHCLHLKSACSSVGNDAVLMNSNWIDRERFAKFEIIEVDPLEPGAANVLLVNDQVIMPSNFPRTAATLDDRGFEIQPLDVSELQKAEAGVTCCSLIFQIKG